MRYWVSKTNTTWKKLLCMQTTDEVLVLLMEIKFNETSDANKDTAEKEKCVEHITQCIKVCLYIWITTKNSADIHHIYLA